MPDPKPNTASEKDRSAVIASFAKPTLARSRYAMMYNTNTKGSSRRPTLRRVVPANSAAGEGDMKGRCSMARVWYRTVFRQKITFIANWIARPEAAPRIRPKLGLLREDTGVLKFVSLKKLKKSPRSWCVSRSVIRVFLLRLTSKFTDNGP